MDLSLAGIPNELVTLFVNLLIELDQRLNIPGRWA